MTDEIVSSFKNYKAVAYDRLVANMGEGLLQGRFSLAWHAREVKGLARQLSSVIDRF
jgi:phage tail tape-measure protein